MPAKETIESLIQIVGRANCRREPLDLETYSHDSSSFIHSPEVVVFPANTQDVAAVAALWARHHIPLTARGAGTSLSGGAQKTTGSCW